jgi:serine/threonine-protein kinase
MIGQSIGNYRVTRLLGEGGMGMVYLAEHPTLGRRAAVKVLHPDLVASHEMIERLFNEARAANAIGHPGIVEVSDLGLLPSGTPYIVMEFLEGQSLGARMSGGGGRLSLRATLEIADQAASAVGAAHAKGIIHRDLKPDNLFLTPDPQWPGRERLKVLDFGIAKLAQRPATAADVRTRTGAILGTPRYMSPEQCRDSRDVDHRTDIYSLGVILYEMLAGTPPFVSSSWGEMAHMHIGVKPPDLRELCPDVPQSIERAVARALEKEPDARFQSMGELRQALDGTLAHEKTIPGTLSWSAGPLPGATLADAPEPASTLRFDAPAVTQPIRRTTLAGAASEMGRPPGTSVLPQHSRRMVPVLVAGLIGVAIVVLGALAALRRPASEPAAGAAGGQEPQRRASAAAVAPAAPRAPAAPAPAVVEPEVPRAISVEIPPKPESAPPIRDQKVTPRSGSPSARPAPAPARHRPADKPRPVPAATTAPEPLKI